MNELQMIYLKNQSVANYAARYLAYLSEIMAKLDLRTIDLIAQVLQDTRDKEGTIFLVGNGGSAATCSHFAEDLALGAFIEGKKPFRVMSLTDNSACMTAQANDEGYESLFVGQLRTLLKQGDVLIAISGSGNSSNIIRAAEYVNMHGGTTIGMVGFDGGEMKNICHYYINVETNKGAYALVEDMHLILGHIISTYLKFKLMD